MDNKALIIKSAATLKKALPLMMKYQVPTTPFNYSLWYCYAANDIPELNVQMDSLIADNDIVPPAQVESLYREFVADKVESNAWALRSSVDKVLIELDKTLVDTANDTDKFQTSFDRTFHDINRVEENGSSFEDIMLLFKKLENDSQSMQRSTQFFSQSLEVAKGEILTLKTQLEKSQKEALYDSLTGLLNRAAFDREANQFLNQAPEGLCVIMVDIDHFKKFNDEWGHLLGDHVLKAVARKLNTNTNNGATAYRFGGEEFVILLPKSQLRIARHYAETLRKAIDKLTLKDKRTDKTINSISASFGVSEYKTGESLSALIARADDFLYEAKRLGRNRVMPM